MPIKVETGVKGRVDWPFLLAAAGLMAMGSIAMLSAAFPLPYFAQIEVRHLAAVAVGVGALVFGLGFNYQVFQDQAKVIYGLTSAILVAVLVVGSSHKGHRSWFDLSFFSFQPAELARIAMILVMAAFLDARARKIRDVSTVLLALGLAAPVMVLIIKQPDFSTTITFCPILLGMLFCAGADLSHLLALMGYGLVTGAMPLLFTYCQVRYPQPVPGSLPALILQTSRLGMATVVVLAAAAVLCLGAWRLSIWLRMAARAVYFVAVPLVLAAGMLSGVLINRQLKSYQRNRFVAYVAPQADIQGAAYHVHQSQIAIGSGGLLGKGLFSGTQSQLGFLPERHTDFIYAVVGEEMGFLGTTAILALYLLLIWRIVAIARVARDRYGYLVCCGLAAMFGFELVLNVGMCVGLLPVAGIPLPLISYGGSSLVITLWSLGIVANVYSRRYALL
ncbi:MAG: rod shape-determining protein RodA [Elusimicrobia bacterium]|nr:rod shape-determining protein RodA [Elusimicrobiota bacterium]